MRLTELHPKLVVGLLEFDCPLGHPHRIIIRAEKWSPRGGFPDALTLTPSVLAHSGVPNDESLSDGQHKAEYDAAARCGWHGFIENGEVRTV